MSGEPLVYLVDDDPSVRNALKRLLSVSGFRCDAFETAQEFLDHAHTGVPACLVLDVNLPGQSGLDLQKELKRRGWPAAIVFITGQGSIPMAVEAIRSGAVHFLPKPFNNEELLAAVRVALEIADREQASLDETRLIQERLKLLTPREHQIFLLVASGKANKTIATQLGVSLQTVKLHRGRVMQKLQFNSVADLVRLAEKTPSARSLRD